MNQNKRSSEKFQTTFCLFYNHRSASCPDSPHYAAKRPVQAVFMLKFELIFAIRNKENHDRRNYPQRP
ncbi:hypothetical protein NEIMUCOT_05416 [Neisseria mucosa ATCC 25996]|uniref:Uncharacterized protein n=1 Tax=Neisseria mucosa (strain ATCC 25996 / DSM 4631 / NCTC 10774 / M26) TaxID=546266 RepID=D2ZXR2_NEIM2|nr:hypothetical protein [Neisseria sicca]EFC88050.1 hypothetical protein NEIMUCOT_05416 [Neisseria mucosa ATCC 25996]